MTYSGLVCRDHAMFLLSGSMFWQHNYVCIIQQIQSQCLSWCKHCDHIGYVNVDARRCHNIWHPWSLGTFNRQSRYQQCNQGWCQRRVHFISGRDSQIRFLAAGWHKRPYLAISALTHIWLQCCLERHSSKWVVDGVLLTKKKTKFYVSVQWRILFFFLSKIRHLLSMHLYRRDFLQRWSKNAFWTVLFKATCRPCESTMRQCADV